jgi:hypothetical protein
MQLVITSMDWAIQKIEPGLIFQSGIGSMRDLNDIKVQLHAYRDFTECIIDSMGWSDYGTTLTINIDYVWLPNGSVRPDDEPRLIVQLSLGLVEEVVVRNALRPAVIADPKVLNWSFAEVARVEVQDDERTQVYAKKGTPSHRLLVYREDGVWIDVVFSELVVTETSGPPPNMNFDV